MKKLSAYTIARYCSDTADIMAGIDEIRERIGERNSAYRKSPHYFYTRLSKLKEKLKKLVTNEKKGNMMNYQCREIKRMIDRYENSGNMTELMNGLKRHIAEYGSIADVAGISKADFEKLGYNMTRVSDVIIEKIASKIDLGNRLDDEICFWADEYGIPKWDR